MFSYLILLMHITACLWAIVCSLESDDRWNWVKNEDIEDSSVVLKYITALYWAVYTI